ncbi:MAG: Acetoin dehydrogenase operon transcriptional activator AcoR [Syntrophomonadaceae bacterium]|nr:Acetoin dehydrogenase operon transcriptional activator AcoR [Bacillota bacterium]
MHDFLLAIRQEMAEYVSRHGLTEEELAESYANCVGLGLESNRSTPKIILSRPEVWRIKKRQRHYLKATLPILYEVYKSIPADFVCFLADHRLISLFTIAGSKKRAECRRIGLRPGTDFSERSAGTDAISACFRLKRTVIIFGPQHYLNDLFGRMWCVASGVYLPNGELLWIFDVSAPTENDLRLAFLVVNLVTKRLEEAVAEVWYRQQGSEAMRVVAASLAVEPLTERELEILLYLIEGKTYADIGGILYLAPGTVNTHVSRIYQKMRVHRREELRARLTAVMRREAKPKSQNII